MLDSNFITSSSFIDFEVTQYLGQAHFAPELELFSFLDWLIQMNLSQLHLLLNYFDFNFNFPYFIPVHKIFVLIPGYLLVID